MRVREESITFIDKRVAAPFYWPRGVARLIKAQKLNHRLEKLRKDTARIYFTITPEIKESFDLRNDEFEVVATDGLKEFDTTFKVFFPQ